MIAMTNRISLASAAICPVQPDCLLVGVWCRASGPAGKENVSLVFLLSVEFPLSCVISGTPIWFQGEMSVPESPCVDAGDQEVSGQKCLHLLGWVWKMLCHSVNSSSSGVPNQFAFPFLPFRVFLWLHYFFSW